MPSFDRTINDIWDRETAPRRGLRNLDPVDAVEMALRGELQTNQRVNGAESHPRNRAQLAKADTRLS